MKEFIDKYKDSITGVLSSFDRIIFKGHLPISWSEGMESFLRREKVLIKDFKRYVTKVSQRIVEHAQATAREAQRPYCHIRGKLDKEAEARALAERDGISEGLVCVFTRVEQAQSFKLKFGEGRPRLASCQPKCLCVYFYCMDPVFGLIHIRLQTWFPFTVQVYLNGHEWLARRMSRRGIAFTQIENAFVAIDDWAKANRIAASLAGLNWPWLLEGLARKINPLMKDLLKGMRHRWVVEQAEYATDILFANRRQLEDKHDLENQRDTVCVGPHKDRFRCRVDFPDMSTGQKPCKGIDPSMRNGACDIRLDSVEHTGRNRGVEENPLVEKKPSAQYS